MSRSVGRNDEDSEGWQVVKRRPQKHKKRVIPTAETDKKKTLTGKPVKKTSFHLFLSFLVLFLAKYFLFSLNKIFHCIVMYSFVIRKKSSKNS